MSGKGVSSKGKSTEEIQLKVVQINRRLAIIHDEKRDLTTEQEALKKELAKISKRIK